MSSDGLLPIEIKSWKYTKWLVATSLGFIGPAIYAYCNHLYFLSGVLVVTSTVSANFWRNATNSWRRDMDLVVAKIAFVIYLVNGCMYVRYVPYMITGSSGLVAIGYCYYMSDKLSSANVPTWSRYHIAFHLWLIYCQWIIIYSVAQ